jgi:urease accessory protein
MKSHRPWSRIVVAVLLGLVASAAQAHTGHATSGLYEGLTHPFGLDHLLAMVAVGIWSVSALPAHKAWWGPATFMASLVVSAALGAMGVTAAFLEHLISLSIVLFGAMLVLAPLKTPPKVGLAWIALAAVMHGLAHGAESPASGFAPYALGFLVTTAALHIGGMVAGLCVKRYLPSKQSWMTTTVGLLWGGAGVYLFSQI